MKNYEMPVEENIADWPAPDQGQFYRDVINGLSACPKRLNAKYFYNAAGDLLFQEIMDTPEYYPAKCEMEIFLGQTESLAAAIMRGGNDFDMIELGAGDATKSTHLLKYLVETGVAFTYKPVDISGHIISFLEETLPDAIPFADHRNSRFAGDLRPG